jgi:hypothetical protein
MPNLPTKSKRRKEPLSVIIQSFGISRLIMLGCETTGPSAIVRIYFKHTSHHNLTTRGSCKEKSLPAKKKAGLRIFSSLPGFFCGRYQLSSFTAVISNPKNTVGSNIGDILEKATDS